MPNTPTAWLNTFSVNAATGAQIQPQITQLADGRILVAWTDQDNNFDFFPGSDIIGQIYDVMGQPVGTPFQMNTYITAADEGEFEIAALPNGGWVIALEDTSSSATHLSVEIYDSTGTRTQFEDLFGSTNGTPNDPAIAVAANGDFMVTWNADGTGAGVASEHIVYDSSAGTFGFITAGLPSSNVDMIGIQQNISAAALSNGTYVVITNRDDGTNEDIQFQIVEADGSITASPVAVPFTSINDEFGVDVAALQGGGFVTVWSQFDGTDVDLFFAVYANDGSLVRTATSVNAASASNVNTQASVAALADGGFIVTYTDSEQDEISAQRYDATGNAVGSEFNVSSAAGAVQPEVVGLGDGRFAITWHVDDGAGGNNVEMAIFDPRDAVNTLGVYAPATVQVGTAIDDFMFTNAMEVYGHDGNDYFFEGTVDGVVFGGDGEDSVRIEGVDTGAFFDGGAGSDWLDIFAVNDGAVFDLLNGEIIDGTEVESFFSVENVFGSNADEEYIGNFADNVFLGLSGEDTMFGNGGDDSLDGGNFNDLLYGNAGQDVILGGAGRDTVDGGTDSDTIYGNGGEDLLLGGGSADSIYGGFGDDTLEGGFGFDLLIGQDGNDVLLGQDGGDRLRGGAGDDTMTGGAGADTFQFALGDGNTRVTDYEDGVDQIQIFSGANSFADVSVFDMGADTGLIFADVFVRLENVDHTNIEATDFLF